MLLKLHQLVNAKPILDKLLAIEMPLKIAFRMTQIVNKVFENFKTFDDLRISLVKKLGVLNETTGTYDIPEQYRDEFVKELNDVLDMEVTIEFTKLNINDMPENVKISPIEWNTISIFFDDLSNS